eukprot:CAMPEP_0113955678 /NCGR_PEP_ID=MMETSP0011_2-20120614/1514_1 /TAXON_ID=101924 /ORGANISM="Rhodosorus marinus" /LENGTH=415 /DNA_ID=CAMNT_0000965489 /DNA_START=37 /DNA_END=1284 /DNA_ORIENTATION=- /assembly_acc=CAM_ASM_000156
MSFVGSFGRGQLRMGWGRLNRCGESVRLEKVLQKGMAFRWREIDEGRTWAGVVKDRLVVLRQEAEEVEYWLEPGQEPLDETLADYFNLRVKCHKLMKTFAEKDENIAMAIPLVHGTRVLRLDPVECLFSFICSSNNNVKRISSMVNFLAAQYGRYVAEYEGHQFYAFPTISELCDKATEQELRENGFGYRARYIVGAARALQERGSEKWLLQLRGENRNQVSEKLVELPGIGKKVASCIALFSLDKHDEIPIDTHIWKMTVSKYMPSLKGKSLTNAVYDQIGDHYRTLFGDMAGWAQTVLFVTVFDDYHRGTSTSKKRKTEKRKAQKTEPGLKAEEECFGEAIPPKEEDMYFSPVDSSENVTGKLEPLLHSEENLTMSPSSLLSPSEDSFDGKPKKRKPTKRRSPRIQDMANGAC